jgi:hypothetical protein
MGKLSMNVAVGLILLTVVMHPLPAQRGGSPSMRPASMAQRWVSEPVGIALTPDQRKRFDSVDVVFRSAIDSARAASKGNEMDFVMRMRVLTPRYQKLIREILRPDQQTVFDKNVEAASIKR